MVLEQTVGAQFVVSAVANGRSVGPAQDRRHVRNPEALVDAIDAREDLSGDGLRLWERLAFSGAKVAGAAVFGVVFPAEVLYESPMPAGDRPAVILHAGTVLLFGFDIRGLDWPLGLTHRCRPDVLRRPT